MPKGAPPRVWVLASPHAGDNTQLMALAEALGWPCEVKRLAYRRTEPLMRLFGLPSLGGIDPARSSPLEAPWPDLLLCSGRGAESVAFWLRRHANPALKLVYLGTPWSSPRRFDLVVATPQYGLAAAPNLLEVALPVSGVTAARLAEEAELWRGRLAHLPAPRIAVLVGGSSGPYVFGRRAAQRLGREASDLARAVKGALLVTTSARTGADATDALRAAIGVPHVFHRWRADDRENPFHAFLALAERIVVTADSISMISEAMVTGKPVALFDIEDGRYSMRAEPADAALGDALPPIGWRGRTPATTVFRLLMNHAPARYARDLRIVHRQLLGQGRVRWVGEGWPEAGPAPDAALAAALSRIRGLFGL